MSRGLARFLTWTAILLAVGAGVLAVWAAGRGSAGDHERAPENTRASGTMALVEVLKREGITVTVTHAFPETAQAVSNPEDTLIVVDDDWWLLSTRAAESLRALDTHLVLVQPTDTLLDELAPGVAFNGFGGGEATAGCSLPAAQRAGTISTEGDTYAVPEGAIGCFSDSSGSSLVRLTDSDRSVTVLGAGSILTHESITEKGNAALALGLLGEHRTLIWYQPDTDDVAFTSDGSIADFQAEWFAPLVVVLLLTGLAAMLWKGRRMGPVVVEDLPVEVRASETMEGRARLYARSTSRNHALATLQRATQRRLARRLGLPRTASPREISAAAAATTGRPPLAVEAILTVPAAADERAFVAMSDALLTLEHDVARDVTPR